jgi:SNF family Na+-dependent transporter
MTGIRQLLNIGIFAFVIIAGLGSAFSLGSSLQVQAQDKYANSECKKTSISLTNLFVIGNNIPIIPAECSTNADGSAKPLSPSLLVDIAIRAYAFLISLGFTIITPSLVGMGVLWIYSGVDEAQATFVKKWAQNLGVGLVMLIFAFVVPFTVMSVLGFKPENTNLDSFFSFK